MRGAHLYGDPLCQSIIGNSIDEAVGNLLVEAVTPVALELTLAVQQEIAVRLHEADRLRRRQIERARYEADLARHRYMQVDPANRLVADVLEADWNARLRALAEAQEEYERRRAADRLAVDDGERQRILALATDFPVVWNDPKTPLRERKRMLGLLIEDVTLIKQREITVAVRFRGGSAATLTLPRPLTAPQLRATHEPVRRQIDALLDEYTDAQVARILNEQEMRTGAGDPFDTVSIKWVRYSAKNPHQTPPRHHVAADVPAGSGAGRVCHGVHMDVWIGVIHQVHNVSEFVCDGLPPGSHIRDQGSVIRRRTAGAGGGSSDLIDFRGRADLRNKIHVDHSGGSIVPRHLVELTGLIVDESAIGHVQRRPGPINRSIDAELDAVRVVNLVGLRNHATDLSIGAHRPGRHRISSRIVLNGTVDFRDVGADLDPADSAHHHLDPVDDGSIAAPEMNIDEAITRSLNLESPSLKASETLGLGAGRQS